MAKDLGIPVVDVDAFGQTELAEDPSLIFDVDLRSLDTVRRLKPLLANRGTGCRVFFIDPDVRVTGVHAQVLGADVTLPKAGTANDVQRAVRKHFGIPARSRTDVAKSIQNGMIALDQTFHSLNARTQLDTDSVMAAGAQIADAIRGAGADAWLAAVKGYHEGTFHHCMLVTGVSASFGARTGMARDDIIKLTTAGLLHDIGKAAVPVEILDKPGALTAGETAILREHPVFGADYLAAHSTIDASIQNAVRHHHEFLDGTGYPDGLRADQIDDLTRILTICDIYAALIERRSYKPANTPEQAIHVLEAMGAAGKVETSLVRALRGIMLPKLR
ncbi:HD domain-containing phosphohydrolase [Devosia sp. 2618]|uniref:HD-GYP domain-containing protein n=1 Tax=Devosia sp. 2618 TaxID=3156454 RepID=UPI003393F437